MRTRLLSVRAVLVAVPLAAAFALTGCPRPSDDWGNGPAPRVMVSFAPLKCFAENVAGGDASIRSILTNQGPHHFDPKPSDIRLLASSDVLFINGLGLEDRAAEKMLRASGNKDLRLVKLGGKIDPKLLIEADHDHDHEGHHHDHDHGDSPNDPHVWLGLDPAVQMVQGIRDELKTVAPKNAAGYDKRAEEYVGKLQKLKADGVAQLAGKTEREFVTFHESLRYFADTFGLKIAGVIQKTPGKETTVKELDALVQMCLEKKVRVIAVEPQYTTQSAASRLKADLELKGVKDVVLVEIDPLETASESDLNAGWYEAKMRANLDALSKALK